MSIFLTEIKRHINLLLMVLLCASATGALADVAIPPLKSHVTDLTGTLTQAEAAQLERQLVDFGAKKGSQIAVLIVPTTQPETIEQYSIRVAEAWALGRKGIDDGVLLLVAKNDKAVRIETGYGLEGALPDAIARRIIDELIVPQFRQGHFFAGLQAGIKQITRVIEGESLPKPSSSGAQADGADVVLENALPFLFIALISGKYFQVMFGRMAGATITSTIAGVLIWLAFSSLVAAVLIALAVFAINLFEQTGRIIHRGGYRSWPGNWPGGGSIGGGFGGGFRGGGGGFGGGGASGRW